VQRSGGKDGEAVGNDDGGVDMSNSMDDPICGLFGTVTDISDGINLGVRTNDITLTIDWHDGDKDKEYSYGPNFSQFPVQILVHAEESLLHLAMLRRNLPCVRVLINKWLDLLNTAPSSLYAFQNFYHHRFPDKDLFRMGEYFPVELEHFLCNISLIRLSNDIVGGTIKEQCIKPDSSIVVGFSPQDRDSLVCDVWQGKLHSNTDGNPEPVTALFLPLKNASDKRHLKLYIDTSYTLDRLNIFRADSVIYASKFTWSRFGRHIHVLGFFRHIFFTCIYTISFYLFERFTQGEEDFSLGLNALAWFFQALVLCGDFIMFCEELQQYMTGDDDGILDHFSNIWNIMNASLIATTTIGTVLRFVAAYESEQSRCMLALGAILMWAKVLYFFRAFEQTGTLGNAI
jgi:hypothetical protein